MREYINKSISWQPLWLKPGKAFPPLPFTRRGFHGLKPYSVTLRVRNLFDKDYAVWGDPFYASQVQLGEPRSIEVALSGRFAGF